MNTEIRLYIRELLILASITGVIIIGVILLMPPQYVSPALPYILVFHTAASLLSYLFIQKKTKNSEQRFINVYLANTTIKLIVYLGVLFSYALIYLHDAVNFIISFFILYVIFTIFEVYHLAKKRKEPIR